MGMGRRRLGRRDGEGVSGFEQRISGGVRRGMDDRATRQAANRVREQCEFLERSERGLAMRTDRIGIFGVITAGKRIIVGVIIRIEIGGDFVINIGIVIKIGSGGGIGV